jgi:hypothetical protein
MNLLAPLLGGLLGTAAMSLLLLLPARLGIARVDVIRAVGAFITGDRQHAFKPGIYIHFALGVFFAYVYYFGFRFTHIPLTPLGGLFAGAVHGVLVMLVVAIAVLEHHPMKRYQRRGPMTGFSQVVGHCVYGLIVGTVCWYLAPNAAGFS